MSDSQSAPDTAIAKPSGARIFLAIPTIDGSICIETMLSIMKNLECLQNAGHSCTLFPLVGDSLVTRARNFLTNAFWRQTAVYNNAPLGTGKFTHMFFWDSDIEVPQDLILKLLNNNAPLTAAAYAKKRYNMDNLVTKLDGFKRVAGREPQSIEEFGPMLTNSNLNLPAGAEHKVVNGCCMVKDAATGLMLIREDCLSLINDKFGEELTYFNDVHVAGQGIGGVPCPRGQRMVDFFGLLIDPVDRRLLSEDYAFCRRYSMAGGQDIPMLVSATTVHHGRASYRCSQLMKWAAEGAFNPRPAEPKAEPKTEAGESSA